MTKEQIKQFEAWHEARLSELGYSREIVLELTNARLKWISQVKVRKNESC